MDAAVEGRRNRPLIRRGQARDLGAVHDLENATFSMDRLSRRSLRYFLQSPTASLLLAEEAQGLAAYALTAFRRGSDVARLYSIAVARQASGRGLGRLLLAASEADAAQRGATWMRLEVRPDNPAAIRLYQAMGYRQFGSIADYYEDDSLALRFEKPLGSRASEAG